MTNLSLITHYLGLKVSRNRPNYTLSFSQEVYLERVFKDYNIFNIRAKAIGVLINPIIKLIPADKGY